MIIIPDDHKLLIGAGHRSQQTSGTPQGIVMLVAGILTFVLASEAMLATLVAAMVALWLIATGRHALTGRHLQLRAHPAAH